MNKLFSYVTVIFISAGLHYLVLDQNLIALKQHLNLEPVLGRMLEDTSVEQDIISVDDKEERIQRFTEWLQTQIPGIYNKFIEALYRTDQSPVAVQLLKSCKSQVKKIRYFINIFN